MSELSEFQREVGEWGDKIFNPNGYNKYSFCDGRIKHFMKEAQELSESCFRHIPKESADCFLLLLHIAHIQGFDLFDEARKKLEINHKRKWGEPDKDGVIEHV